MADLSALADEVEEGVRGSVRDLKRELRQATREAQIPRARGVAPVARDWERGGRTDGRPAAAERPTEVERKAADLLAEVRRWVRARPGQRRRTCGWRPRWSTRSATSCATSCAAEATRWVPRSA